MACPVEAIAEDVEMLLPTSGRAAGAEARIDARRCRFRFGALATIAMAGSGAVAFAVSRAALRKPLVADVTNAAAAWVPAPFDSTELISADTRHPWSWQMEGVPGRHFVNYAVGKTWRGWLTKTDAWLDAARQQAAKNPDDIVILMDTDMVNGGCSDRVFFERYVKIVRASGGAPIVLGADLHPWPMLPGHVERFMGAEMQARRRAVLAEFGMTPEAIDKWAMAHFDPTSFSFVNAGFIMGPAALLERAVMCARLFGWSGGDFDDQRGFTVCASRHPDKITIDYSGSLSVATYTFNTGFLQGTPTGIMNTLVNDGAPQCFVHLNGGGLPAQRRWAEWKNALPTFAR